ncbi:hypothetical protein ACQKFK_29855 [Bacillus mycoides]|uniref:hypothetical protein n=1 Tax=Bacillus mycoides TaxID=1405 RepID=UPI003D026F1F
MNNTLNNFEELNEAELELNGGWGEEALGDLVGWITSESNKNKNKYCGQYKNINDRNNCYYLWEN